ncbi:MAG: iron-sulfur cluster assembly protein [Candidatus Hydrothermarchaeaceae archaeon]
MVEKEQVIEELKKVMDPHTNQDVYEMGLVKDLRVEGAEVSLTFVPSSPYCPLGVQLATSIRDQVNQMEGVEKVNVTVDGYIQKDQLNKMLKEEV